MRLTSGILDQPVAPSHLQQSGFITKNNFDQFIVLRKYSEIKSGNKGDTCTVCLEEFVPDNEVRQILVCRHIFHENCIREWTFSQKNCPNCKLEFSKENFEGKKFNPLESLEFPKGQLLKENKSDGADGEKEEMDLKTEESVLKTQHKAAEEISTVRRESLGLMEVESKNGKEMESGIFSNTMNETSKGFIINASELSSPDNKLDQLVFKDDSFAVADHSGLLNDTSEPILNVVQHLKVIQKDIQSFKKVESLSNLSDLLKPMESKEETFPTSETIRVNFEAQQIILTPGTLDHPIGNKEKELRHFQERKEGLEQFERDLLLQKETKGELPQEEAKGGLETEKNIQSNKEYLEPIRKNREREFSPKGSSIHLGMHKENGKIEPKQDGKSKGKVVIPNEFDQIVMD